MTRRMTRPSLGDTAAEDEQKKYTYSQTDSISTSGNFVQFFPLRGFRKT